MDHAATSRLDPPPQYEQYESEAADLDNIFEVARLSDFRTSIDFINALRDATLDGKYSNLSPSAIQRIRNPISGVFDFNTDPDLRLGLDLFLANINSSAEAYNNARDAIKRRHPEDQIPSHDQIKRRIEDITGVGSISHAMCKNSCMAFTGPLSELDACPRCGTPKFCPETKKLHQEFVTIPIAPILQAMWRDPGSAIRLSYRRRKTQEIITELQEILGSIGTYEDFLHGSDYLESVRSGKIQDRDMVLMFSLDGAQLYAHKSSDCWIYIWVLFDLSPEERYKKHHVLPGGFIPGPNKPKNMDSFLFPGLYHLAAIQNEGLSIWDASLDSFFLSKLFLAHIDVSMTAPDWCPNIARWARLRLPNRQIARSKWKEGMKALDKIRIARNVKVSRFGIHGSHERILMNDFSSRITSAEIKCDSAKFSTTSGASYKKIRLHSRWCQCTPIPILSC